MVIKVSFILFFLYMICNAADTTALSNPTVIQVGTYAESMKHIAEREKTKYLKQGFKAYLVPVLNPSPKLTGKYYRLRIGPFKNEQSAALFRDKHLNVGQIQPWIDENGKESASTDNREPIDSVKDSGISREDTTVIIDFDIVDDTIAIELVHKATYEDSLKRYPKIEPTFYDEARERLLDSLKRRSKRRVIISRISTAVIGTGFAAVGYYLNSESDKLYAVYRDTNYPLPAADFDKAWKEIEALDKKRDMCYTASCATGGLFSVTFIVGNKKRRERRHEKR